MNASPRLLVHPRDEIVRTMERIYRYRMTTTSGGNLSVRDEDGDVWITPARVDKGSLRREDVVRVRADGGVEGLHRPSSEHPFHQGDLPGAARPPRRRPRPSGRPGGVQHLPPRAGHVADAAGRTRLRRRRLRAVRPARQRAARPQHRRRLRPGVQLRAAGEPRRRHRRGQLGRGVPALRDPGIHGQDDHQGQPARPGALPDAGADRPVAAAASRCRSSSRDRPARTRRSCAEPSANSSVAATASA